MTKYDFKNKYTHMLKKARTSFTNKKKAGWSRNVSAGFLKEEIRNITMHGKGVKIFYGTPLPKDKLVLIDKGFIAQYDNINEINLRELEEMILWLNEKVAKEELNRLLKRKVVDVDGI